MLRLAPIAAWQSQEERQRLHHTTSLYSTVFYGKWIANDSDFIGRALDSLRESMQDDGQQFIYQRLIAPASASVRFARALDRSVTGSMNDLVFHAKVWLMEGELCPHDVGLKLNEIPFSSLKYANPKEAFKAMHVAPPAEAGDRI